MKFRQIYSICVINLPLKDPPLIVPLAAFIFSLTPAVVMSEDVLKMISIDAMSPSPDLNSTLLCGGLNGQKPHLLMTDFCNY